MAIVLSLLQNQRWRVIANLILQLTRIAATIDPNGMTGIAVVMLRILIVATTATIASWNRQLLTRTAAIHEL